jgi:hypothetical protein
VFIVQHSNSLPHIYFGEKTQPHFSHILGTDGSLFPTFPNPEGIINKQRTIFINPERVTFFLTSSFIIPCSLLRNQIHRLPFMSVKNNPSSATFSELMEVCSLPLYIG